MKKRLLLTGLLVMVLTLFAFPMMASAGGEGAGKALDFDGSDDYVDVPHDDGLNVTDTLTMEAWVKLDNSSDNQKVVGKSTTSRGYVLGVSGGKLYPEIWDNTGTHYSFQSGSIPSGEWTHLAVTWTTGQGQMVGYVNGVQVNSIPAGSNPIGTTSNSLIIGAAPWSHASFFVAGQVDEVRI